MEEIITLTIIILQFIFYKKTRMNTKLKRVKMVVTDPSSHRFMIIGIEMVQCC